MDNSKFFANEEMIRSRKEVQEKDEQLLNLHRKWQEESKQREHLQKEVDRLKVSVVTDPSHATTPSYLNSLSTLSESAGHREAQWGGGTRRHERGLGPQHL